MGRIEHDLDGQRKRHLRAPPAHDLMQSLIRSLNPLRVVALHPVAQRLAPRAVQRRASTARPAFKDHRHRQDAASLRAIRAARRCPAPLRRGDIQARNPHCTAHATNACRRPATQTHRVRVQAKWESSRETRLILLSSPRRKNACARNNWSRSGTPPRSYAPPYPDETQTPDTETPAAPAPR